LIPVGFMVVLVRLCTDADAPVSSVRKSACQRALE
jgi:hypothetical protein